MDSALTAGRQKRHRTETVISPTVKTTHSLITVIQVAAAEVRMDDYPRCRIAR